MPWMMPLLAAMSVLVTVAPSTMTLPPSVFTVSDWPAGNMVTPTLAGTRPGGAIAAAWAVMAFWLHGVWLGYRPYGV